ncbi:ATP:cob(I)alamin adenosyltransferase [Patescibacteria group bacterium]
MTNNDQLFTCLGSKRIKKSAKVLEALGDLDELNATLGLVRAFTRKKKLEATISSFQNDLVQIGGWLSGFSKLTSLEKKTLLLKTECLRLSDSKLRRFSLPGKNKVSTFLHLSRVITRRLERRVVGLNKSDGQEVVAYLNKLSLMLFWLSVSEEKKAKKIHKL